MGNNVRSNSSRNDGTKIDCTPGGSYLNRTSVNNDAAIAEVLHCNEYNISSDESFGNSEKNENLKNKDIPTNSESEVENEVKATPQVRYFTVIDQQVIAKNNKSDSLCTGFNSAHSHYWVEDASIKDLLKDMKKKENKSRSTIQTKAKACF